MDQLDSCECNGGSSGGCGRCGSGEGACDRRPRQYSQAVCHRVSVIRSMTLVHPSHAPTTWNEAPNVLAYSGPVCGKLLTYCGGDAPTVTAATTSVEFCCCASVLLQGLLVHLNSGTSTQDSCIEHKVMVNDRYIYGDASPPNVLTNIGGSSALISLEPPSTSFNLSSFFATPVYVDTLNLTLNATTSAGASLHASFVITNPVRVLVSLNISEPSSLVVAAPAICVCSQGTDGIRVLGPIQSYGQPRKDFHDLSILGGCAYLKQPNPGTRMFLDGWYRIQNFESNN